jgi:hypothetical protein
MAANQVKEVYVQLLLLFSLFIIVSPLIPRPIVVAPMKAVHMCE